MAFRGCRGQREISRENRVQGRNAMRQPTHHQRLGRREPSAAVRFFPGSWAVMGREILAFAARASAAITEKVLMPRSERLP